MQVPITQLVVVLTLKSNLIRSWGRGQPLKMLYLELIIHKSITDRSLVFWNSTNAKFITGSGENHEKENVTICINFKLMKESKATTYKNKRAKLNCCLLLGNYCNCLLPLNWCLLEHWFDTWRMWLNHSFLKQNWGICMFLHF